MDKNALRKQLLQQRRAVRTSDAHTMSVQVASVLKANVDWRAIQTVHAYQSNTRWNEVDTSWLRSYLAAQWPHISLTMGVASRSAAFAQGSFDLVIVPLVGFDDRLYRLGHGGGWYDKFLATQPAAIKIGLAFEMQRIAKLPHEHHDIPMDMIVTERRVVTK